MKVARRPTGRTGERSKAAILAAASAVFADQGPGAPVSAVAARCGRSKALIFEYFGSRESLLAAVAEQWLRQSYRYLLDPDWPGDPARQLARIVEASFGAVTADPAGFRMVEAMRLDRGCQAIIDAAEEQAAPLLILRAERIDAAFRQLRSPHPALDAQLFTSALTGLLLEIGGAGDLPRRSFRILERALLQRFVPLGHAPALPRVPAGKPSLVSVGCAPS
jgi:AcrR family transcriptional regulator